MTKAKIFIGSSVEGLNIAYAIQQNLTHDAEITAWDQGVFELSQTTLESLLLILERSDFAIFVFSPDDILKIRKKEFLAVRDNVIFELGMFLGKLGRNRSFIVMPDKPLFHIPTDLLGITAGKFDTSRTDGSYQAATGPVCHQIRTQIRRLGLLQIGNNETTIEKETSEPQQELTIKNNNWWSYYSKKQYDTALELIDEEIETEMEPEKKYQLTFWKIYIGFQLDSNKGKVAIKLKLLSDSNIKTYVSIARILLWEDELDYAVKIIDEGLTKFGNDESLILRKCEYFEKVGKLDDAVSLIKKANYSESETLSIKLADLYETFEEKKSDEAFSLIKDLYLKNPSSKEVAYKLARLSQDTQKPQTALYLFDKLTIKYSSNNEYWAYLANTCHELGLYNRAMIAYKKADDTSDPKQAWILANIGNLLQNRGFYTEGRSYFDRSLTIEPNYKYCFERIAGTIKLEEEETEKYSKWLIEGLNLISETSGKVEH